MNEKCLICETEEQEKKINVRGINYFEVTCPRCGIFRVDGNTADLINEHYRELRDDKIKYNNKIVLSHLVAKSLEASKANFFNLTKEFFEENKNNVELPNPAEQADNLIMYIGTHARFHTDQVQVSPLKLTAIIGAYKEKSITLITNELQKQELIDCYGKGNKDNASEIDYMLSLTFKGWQRYEELKKVRIDSKQVFMAMQFSNTELNDLFNNHLVKAVKQTGLDLRKLTDIPKDGIIDNHLRVEIRKSCLLIADLSDDNHGAYWEAGYAEGLGKPVIYLCEETKFKKESTHFDTSHLQTIPWKTGNEEECVKKLKDLIRVVLPDKAKMEDD